MERIRRNGKKAVYRFWVCGLFLFAVGLPYNSEDGKSLKNGGFFIGPPLYFVNYLVEYIDTDAKK